MKKDDNCNLLECIINIKDNWNIKDNLKNREMEISSIILSFLWTVPLDNQIAEEGAEETPFWCSNSEKEMWSHHHFTTPSELLDLYVEHRLPLIFQREMTKRVNASYQWKNPASCIVCQGMPLGPAAKMQERRKQELVKERKYTISTIQTGKPQV